MVPVQMGNQDRIDCGGVDSGAFHRDQRRGAAVDQEAGRARNQMDAGLKPASAAEVVPAAQKTQPDVSDRRRHRIGNGVPLSRKTGIPRTAARLPGQSVARIGFDRVGLIHGRVHLAFLWPGDGLPVLIRPVLIFYIHDFGSYGSAHLLSTGMWTHIPPHPATFFNGAAGTIRFRTPLSA